MTVRWAIFYADGSSFTSDDGGPEDAPTGGVELVCQADGGCGRVDHFGSDHYAWHRAGVDGSEAGEWLPHAAAGIRYFRSVEGHAPHVVLDGYMVPNGRWYEIHKAALADPRLAIKTGGDPREPGRV